AGGLAPTGPAADGEVEDYAITLQPPVSNIFYVDDDWAGTTPGTNPANNPNGPLAFGTTAFATIQDAIDKVAGSGYQIVVYGGPYPAAVNINQSVTSFELSVNSTIPGQTAVAI